MDKKQHIKSGLFPSFDYDTHRDVDLQRVVCKIICHIGWVNGWVHSFMQRPVHPLFGLVKTVVDG